MTNYHKITILSWCVLSTLYGNVAMADNTKPDEAEESSDSEVMVVMGTPITVTRDELENAPGNNPSVPQALKYEPRIGIDDAQGAMQGGDLAPEEISISGARPHQTKYTIGGVGVNNSTTFGSDNELPSSLSSGHTSGYFVDTNLVDSVEVLDHNITAEHGGFTGGVVNAELRKPTDDFTIDYNLRVNDSSWNAAQKVGENFKDAYGTPIDGSGKYQPNFQKRMHALHMSGAINDNQRLAVNVSHQASDIPLSNGKDVDQKMDNLFITHALSLGAWETTTDFRYASHKTNRFMNDPHSDEAAQANSESVNYHSGLGGTIKISGDLDAGTWDSSLSYDHLADKREADAEYFVVYMKMDEAGKVKFHNEGNYGNLNKTQDTYQFKTAFNFKPIYNNGISYMPSVGANVKYDKASTDRPNDHVVYQHRELVAGNPMIPTLTRYEAANYSADAQQYGLFAGNQMQWDQWGMYLGGRADHMSVFSKTVFSPRFNTSWDFDTPRTNRITFGANRYYSGNLLGWAMKSEQSKYQSHSKNCSPADGDWSNTSKDNLICTSMTTNDGLDLSQADVPYADEFSASWDVDVNNFNVNTGYIYRMQRSGLSYSSNSTTGAATLHNNVKSDNQIFSIEVSTIRPYEIAGGLFSANWKIAYDHRRGTGDLKASYDESNDLNGGFQDEWVMIDGQLVRYGEMDVSGYQSPIKSSIDLNMNWQDIGLVLNNRINYQQGKNTTAFTGMERVEIDGQNEMVSSLETTKLDALVTWDMAVNWTPTQFNDHATFGLSVTNILNNQQVVSKSGMNLGRRAPNDYYNTGRQVWLNLNLRN